jgi:hypothetical protein
VSGVDDCIVLPGLIIVIPAKTYMQLAWAVAALATDGQVLRRQFPIVIPRMLNPVRVVRMAEQAAGEHGAIELVNGLAQMRRQIPSLPVCIPAYRGLVQITVAVDEVRSSAFSSPNGVPDFSFSLSDHLPLLVHPTALVYHLAFAYFDFEFQPGRLKGILACGINTLLLQKGGHRRDRLAHRMTAIGHGDRRVTLRTRLIADVMYIGPHVLKLGFKS